LQFKRVINPQLLAPKALVGPWTAVRP